MNSRDVTKLQYEKGQQIKAADVNTQMAQAFTRFNGMAPTDVAPLTTGQFRVFEPRVGYKLVPSFTTNTQWYPVGACAVNDADTFTLNHAANYGSIVLGVLAGPAPYALLIPGHRYQVYFKVHNDIAVAGTIRFYNAATITATYIYNNTIALSADLSGDFSFVAQTAYFAIGGKSSGAAIDITVLAPLSMGGVGVGIYIFDWTDNRWIIPNHCGFISPSTPGILPAAPETRRENHYLLCQAIKKEIDATNEVLNYL